ncbi:unnamed protein product [Brassica oleracea var. botrytis]
MMVVTQLRSSSSVRQSQSRRRLLPEKINPNSFPLQVNHLPTVKPVWWRWLLEGGGGGLCHGGGCRGDGCRSGGCGYVCGRREGGIVVVEVAIREEEVVVNTVEVKYVRSW